LLPDTICCVDSEALIFLLVRTDVTISYSSASEKIADLPINYMGSAKNKDVAISGDYGVNGLHLAQPS
jgi:hypothetical protein